MQLAVRAVPKASKDAVVGWRIDDAGERELEVRVTAVPEKGKATKAVSKVLAAFFGVPKSSVVCVRGETSRHKLFELPIDDDALRQVDNLG